MEGLGLGWPVLCENEDRAEPNRARPGQAEPDGARSRRAEPSRALAMTSRAKPEPSPNQHGLFFPSVYHQLFVCTCKIIDTAFCSGITCVTWYMY